MGLVHWAIVVVIFVPLLFLFWQRFRVGAPINNSLIQYGPVPREVTYAYWVVFSFIVTATTVTWVAKLGTKMLTIRGLWIAYFLVGTMFNLVAMDILPDHLNSEHQLGNVRHNGFIATSWMHLIVEAMLLVSVFVPKSQCDWCVARLVARARACACTKEGSHRAGHAGPERRPFPPRGRAARQVLDAARRVRLHHQLPRLHLAPEDL